MKSEVDDCSYLWFWTRPLTKSCVLALHPHTSTKGASDSLTHHHNRFNQQHYLQLQSVVTQPQRRVVAVSREIFPRPPPPTDKSEKRAVNLSGNEVGALPRGKQITKWDDGARAIESGANGVSAAVTMVSSESAAGCEAAREPADASRNFRKYP